MTDLIEKAMLRYSASRTLTNDSRLSFEGRKKLAMKSVIKFLFEEMMNPSDEMVALAKRTEKYPLEDGLVRGIEIYKVLIEQFAKDNGIEL